jgi:hypothetical protein
MTDTLPSAIKSSLQVQAVGVEIAERVHAEECSGIVRGGDVPLSALAATHNALEMARFMKQAATSAFTLVAGQHHMLGVRVESSKWLCCEHSQGSRP